MHLQLCAAQSGLVERARDQRVHIQLNAGCYLDSVGSAVYPITESWLVWKILTRESDNGGKDCMTNAENLHGRRSCI